MALLQPNQEHTIASDKAETRSAILTDARFFLTLTVTECLHSKSQAALSEAEFRKPREDFFEFIFVKEKWKCWRSQKNYFHNLHSDSLYFMEFSFSLHHITGLSHKHFRRQVIRNLLFNFCSSFNSFAALKKFCSINGRQFSASLFSHIFRIE